MQTTPMPIDNPGRQQYEIAIDGETAYAQYEVENGIVTFTHTFVPEALRGRGLATRLVEAALGMARDRGLKVVPQCRVFAGYMNEHPDTNDLLAAPGPR